MPKTHPPPFCDLAFAGRFVKGGCKHIYTVLTSGIWRRKSLLLLRDALLFPMSLRTAATRVTAAE